MKSLILFLICILSLFGQENTLTNEIYWKSQPIEVQALNFEAMSDVPWPNNGARTIPLTGTVTETSATVTMFNSADNTIRESRMKLAEKLAKAGYKIDIPIMVYGWDALKVMQLRKSYGFTWVPSALQQNIEIAPGLASMSGNPYDPGNPPPGSITVSTDAKDYPEWKPAVEKPVETAKSPVGPLSIGKLYLTVTGDRSPGGTWVKEERGTFIKRVQASPFGEYAYWEKVD